MGRRRGSTEFTAVRSLSWPLELAVGVGAFFAIRTGVPWLLPQQGGPLAHLTPALGWRAWSHKAGASSNCLWAKRSRQGYAMKETCLQSTASGVGLILRKNGCRTLMQCNQWKRQQLGVSVLREIFVLLEQHNTDEMKIVCIGTNTKYAERFAKNKPIALVSNVQLLGMIRMVQLLEAPAMPIEPSFERGLALC